MGIVDPDAHVIEIDKAWEYMDPGRSATTPGQAL